MIGQKEWEETRVNDLNKNGESLSYLSAMHGHYPIVHWLIFQGSDVNFQVKNDGNSLLHMASTHGHISVARRLVTSFGCQKDLLNQSGKTAFQEAGSLEKNKILALKKRDLKWHSSHVSHKSTKKFNDSLMTRF